MPHYVRNNAWNQGGTFDNSDLLWYAKGVGQMMSRALNDPTSWWFYAAIHGEYVNPATSWYPNPVAFPAWGDITSPPSVPTTPLPSATTQELYWNQCQHGSWYFLPWHRGYLMALETQLRQDIVKQGGPATWALPYWNYFGGEGGSQFQMPSAFAQEKLPDGSANPLYLSMRYGPDGDANIYVPTAAGEAAHPNDPNLPPAANEVTEQPALSETQFSKADPLYGFGGPDTGFSHDGGHFGRLESNPHNKVHVYVGGTPSSTSPLYGLMADPGTAALDPIFYLHHCNIDRLWGVWNASGNANPTAPSWLDGPAQQFAMPDLNGQPWYYTPKQVTDLSALDYSYQELIAQPAAEPELATRLTLLGAPAAAARAVSESTAAATPRQPELLGANSGPLRIPAGGTQTVVKLDPSVRSKTIASLARATETAQPDKAFLKLENVRGTFDATVLRVYVQVAGGGDAILADTVALFGLRRASVADGQHGGEGLTLVVDITHILDQLHLTGELNADALQVNIVPNRPLPDGAAVEVGRVSVYRQAL